MRWKTTALTLFFTLGVVSWVCADESGNWFSRMFSAGAKKSDADKKPLDKDSKAKADEWTPGTPVPKTRSSQPAVDWQRRLEVCTRLRDVAMEVGDADLERKAEALEKRVFDAYIAASNRADASKQVIGEVSVKDLKALDKPGKGNR